MRTLVHCLLGLILVCWHTTGAASQISSLPAWHGDALDVEWGNPPERPGGRSLQDADTMPEGNPCPAFSKEVLDRHAKDNTVLIMCIDKVLFKRFAHSWIHNVKAANITYWYVAAMDPWASKALGAMGVTQCFNAPVTSVESGVYQWGNERWHQTTWKKVHVMKAVYDLGYHVVHSDADATWWNDPLPWFQKHVVTSSERHGMFTTDSLDTRNKPRDMGPEADTTPFFNINTGIYFIKQYAEGKAFFDIWLDLEHKKIGHDQDGLNTVVRGHYMRGDPNYPQKALWDTPTRHILCALHNVTKVGLLPVHLFGNAYTYNIGRVQDLYNSTLYVTHWVWTGGSPESKIQHIRDAGRYVDPPTWYGLPPGPDALLYEYTEHAGPDKPQQLMLLSMDLDAQEVLPEGYNQWPMSKTEEMVQFHLKAAQRQLEQTYWGLVAAAGLGRTLILPDFQCYCTKNWYMTQACRINGEKHTTFPYHCPLSDFFRAKKVLSGIEIPVPGQAKMVVHVRERNFLSNPQVPQEIKSSKLVVRPIGSESASGVEPTALNNLEVVRQRDGSDRLNVPWPLTTDALLKVITGLPGSPYRHVHLTNATQIVGRGFADTRVWAAFDAHIERYVTYWCCRSPQHMTTRNLTDKVYYTITPLSRRALAPL